MDAATSVIRQSRKSCPSFGAGLAAFMLFSVPQTGFAQSVVTLDSFDLGGTTEEAQTEETNCLLNADDPACNTGDVSGTPFSLNDVVNLGIIDREEVQADPGEEVDVAAAADPLPSIDLQILFDYASDALRSDQLPPLITLAQDLQGIDFQRATLVVMGHTDGVGSADYNRALSQRRADSVAGFIGAQANIPRSRIRTSGMGFDFLLYPNDPANAANRRVQILLVE